MLIKCSLYILKLLVSFITAKLRGTGSTKQETRLAEKTFIKAEYRAQENLSRELWVETSHVIKANRGELLIFGDIIPI